MSEEKTKQPERPDVPIHKAPTGKKNEVTYNYSGTCHTASGPGGYATITTSIQHMNVREVLRTRNLIEEFLMNLNDEFAAADKARELGVA